MKSNRHTALYIVFYLLFSPDTWRILIGLVAACLLGPRVTANQSFGPLGEVVVWLMILTLGYTLSAPLGKAVSSKLTAVVRRASNR